MQRLRPIMVAMVLLIGVSIVLGGCCPETGCPPRPMDWNLRIRGDDGGGA